ncbi:hypothetical protein [Nocardia brasiliensis]|uniref:hypothetical protein n=1 Tax=Nocardia brasiliensis TaxID=37326 RepID=UPI0024589167|nr:hypothetical protein [Nocardia brasiliensis]
MSGEHWLRVSLELHDHPGDPSVAMYHSFAASADEAIAARVAKFRAQNVPFERHGNQLKYLVRGGVMTLTYHAFDPEVSR